MTDTNGVAHDHTIARIYPRIAETGTAKDILSALADTN